MATLIDVKGSLYGTTKSGGNGDGTVYRVSTTGSESVVYSFAGGSDGAHPDGGLMNAKGELYGTTYDGGAFGEGTVYSVSTNGIEKVLHSFGGDGANPFTGLVQRERHAVRDYHGRGLEWRRNHLQHKHERIRKGCA